MEEMCRAKGEEDVPSLCALVSTAPSQKLPVFKNAQALWAVFMYIFLGFTKQAYWLDHQPLAIDLILRSFPSPQRCWKLELWNGCLKFLGDHPHPEGTLSLLLLLIL